MLLSAIILYIIYGSPLPVENVSSVRAGAVFCSLLYSQSLGPCLAHSEHHINICCF